MYIQLEYSNDAEILIHILYIKQKKNNFIWNEFIDKL